VPCQRLRGCTRKKSEVLVNKCSKGLAFASPFLLEISRPLYLNEESGSIRKRDQAAA
jgi:hypothetical protein